MIDIKGNKNLNVGDKIIFTHGDYTEYCGIIVEKNTLPNNTIDFKIKLDDGRLLRKRHNHLNIVNN